MSVQQLVPLYPFYVYTSAHIAHAAHVNLPRSLKNNGLGQVLIQTVMAWPNNRLGTTSWYPMILAALICLGKADLVGKVFRFFWKCGKTKDEFLSGGGQSPDDLKLIARRFGDMCRILWPLVGMPPLITALRATAIIELEWAADGHVRLPENEEEDHTPSDHVSTRPYYEDIELEGTWFWRTMNALHLPRIKTVDWRHTWEWQAKHVVYNLFLSNTGSILEWEAELILMTGMLCKGYWLLTRERMAKLRAMGMQKDDLKAAVGVIHQLAAWARVSTAGWATVDDVPA